MLIITDLNGNIAGAFSGSDNTLTTIYPDNPEVLTQYKEYQFPDNKDALENPSKYKVENGKCRLKTPAELNPPPTREEKIVVIKTKYQAILDNLLATKQRMEMLGQPVTAIVDAYQTKKAEMEAAIRGVV